MKPYYFDLFDVPGKCLNKRGHTKAPLFGKFAAAFAEIEAATDAAVDPSARDNTVAPVEPDVPDAMVVDNFVNYTKKALLADIDAATAAGDCEAVALMKRELLAVDEFVRLAMPVARVRVMQRVERDDPVLALLSKIEAVLGK